MTQNCHIVVIDDDLTILNITKMGLERQGFKVTLFSKPDEAISYFQEHNSIIDLIITDKNMPIITGEEILRIFKKTCPLIPIIVLTGFLDEEEAQELNRLGSSKNLLKPISLKELSAEIKGLLKITEERISLND